MSAFLSFMGISGFFGKRNISKIEVSLEFPEEIYANKAFPLNVIPSNAKRFLPGFLLKILVEEREILFPFREPGAVTGGSLTLSFRKRGLHEIEGINVCSVFPFNFFIRCRQVAGSYSVLVLPEPRKCGLPGLFEKEQKLRGEETSDRTGHEPEVISVRDYITGDPLKYINWKATAKTGDLKTKELSSLLYQPVIIDFDSIEIENLERKISCLTYTVLQFSRKGIPFGFRINGRFYRPDTSRAHKMNVLRELALYGYTPPA